MRIDMRAVVRAHGYLRTECPPEPWEAEADDHLFFRMLGEMIAAGLAKNGQKLEELTLNVANVTVDLDDDPEADSVPAGDFVAITIRGAGDYGPEMTWPGERPLLGRDLDAAARAVGAVYGYTRALGGGEGSVTVFVRRALSGPRMAP